MGEELPNWVGAGLDVDVARWLIIRADRLYNGSMELAINATVRAIMGQEAPVGHFRDHAGLSLPCTPCGGPCVVDEPNRSGQTKPDPGA